MKIKNVNIFIGMIRFGILYTNKQLNNIVSVANLIDSEREKVDYSMCKIENKKSIFFKGTFRLLSLYAQIIQSKKQFT